MELEIGMYVRTKYGYIAKCIYTDEELEGIYAFDSAIRRSFGDEYDFIHCEEKEKYITKASHNIIDLIEVGDYVNGYKVADIDRGKYSVFIEEPKDYVWQCLWNNDIKSIVTKEQMASISYKVGD